MNISKIISFSFYVISALGMSAPVSAQINATTPVLSATGVVIDINPLLSDQKQIITPHSGFIIPGDLSLKAHTNYKFMIPHNGLNSLNTQISASPFTAIGKPPLLTLGYNTPASIACIYNLVTAVPGCIPDQVTTHATGGSKAIAIVDAYHYPNANTDLTTFSLQFGLPIPSKTNFQVVYASGTQPPNDPYGWEVEAALDLQWAHALAPNAKLILVEADSNSVTDLNKAVVKASALVAAAGGGQVSMSYGRSEWATESNFEATFKTPKVVYFASSGDDDGTSYPCVSPNVVCVGGTTLRRNTSTKAFFQEIAWQDGGSGISTYFSRPAFQKDISTLVGNRRGVPDVSIVADPDSGVWIHYSSSDDSGSGWMIVGGTSLSSAIFAGIVNSSAKFYTSSAIELTQIYTAGLGTSSASMFRNISAGYCGPYVGWNATLTPKWDLCTGLGTPLGKSGK